MQLKCIVMEDGQRDAGHIRGFISKIPFLKMLQQHDDEAEAFALLESEPVDLLFVNVDNPVCIARVESMQDKPMMIFTSAFKKYAWKGFDYGAIDYLLKPFHFERFYKAAKRAVDHCKMKQAALLEKEDILFVRSGYSLVKILLSEIEYIEGFIDYIKIHISYDKPVIAMMTLKAVMEKLPMERFQRIHRSYIVALSQVMSLKNKKAVLFSHAELPVSRRVKMLHG